MPHPRRKTKRNPIRDKNNGHNIKRKLFLVAIFIIGALILYQPIKNLAVSKLIQYGTAQWKVLDNSIANEAAIIRDETVITAPAQGLFEPLVNEGEKVAAGKTIGYLKTQGATDKADFIKLPVKAPRAGLVSFHPDGLEEILKPDLLNDLDIDKISALLEERQASVSRFPQVERGKPVCKIVDNLINPYLYIQCPSTSLCTLEKGQVMKVRFPDGTAAEIRLYDVKKRNDQYVFIAEIFNAPDFDLKNRFIPINVAAETFEGITVLKEALVKRNGEDGIYVPRKGICKWVKVEVKGCVGEEAVISGLDAGAQYIINPSLVHEGQRID
ncbi:MAG: HlyD family efflux transporter periplasmic adaptor subunit [Bacillota bacterium]|jgi:putative membrane fusion protein